MPQDNQKRRQIYVEKLLQEMGEKAQHPEMKLGPAIEATLQNIRMLIGKQMDEMVYISEAQCDFMVRSMQKVARELAIGSISCDAAILSIATYILAQIANSRGGGGGGQGSGGF